MKSIFYFSQKMQDRLDSAFIPSLINTIDGKRFNETRTVEDDAPIEPFNKWGDNVLVAVVENVKVDKDGFTKDEELEKRIKYK